MYNANFNGLICTSFTQEGEELISLPGIRFCCANDVVSGKRVGRRRTRSKSDPVALVGSSVFLSGVHDVVAGVHEAVLPRYEVVQRHKNQLKQLLSAVENLNPDAEKSFL